MRVLITAIVIIVSMLLMQSCGKDELKEAVQLFGGVAEDAGKATFTNPEFLAAYANGGWDEAKEVGLPIFWSNLKLKSLKLANGSKVEQRLFDLIMEESDLVGRMIYRETDLGPAGIWVDLTTAAQSVGYDGASLGLVLVLTDEQWEWLGANIGPLALLHYNAVKAEGKVDTVTTDGIDTGGDW